MLLHKAPKSIYFRRGSMATAVEDLKEFKRVCVVTNTFFYQRTSFAQELVDMLKARHLEHTSRTLDYHVFYEAENATASTIQKGFDVMQSFEPDLIIAMGDGRTMEAAKLMYLRYEDPTANLKELSTLYGGLQPETDKVPEKEFPKMGVKAKLVCIPTTSGSGTEVTPFATMVAEGGALGEYKRWRCPIAHFELTPFMAIVDPNLIMNMPRDLTAQSGMNALAHAIEAYTSVCSNEFTEGQALQALKLLKMYLPRAYLQGKGDPVAREKVHNAATIAGIAHANAGMGICHSMGHAMETLLNIPRGMAKALLLSNVIRYNLSHMTSSNDSHQKECQYAEMARYLSIVPKTSSKDPSKDASAALLEWLQKLKEDLSIPSSIKEWGVREALFQNELEALVEMAWADPCVNTNARPPIKDDLRNIFLDSYYGRSYLEF